MATENFRRTDIILDYATDNIDWITPLKAQTGDYNGRGLRVQITDGGQVADQSALEVLFGFYNVAAKSSGVVVMTATDATNGIFDVSYPTDMLQAAGTCICQIKIVDGDAGAVVLSANFNVQVEKSTITDEMQVAQDSVTVLDKAIIDISTLERRVAVMETGFEDMFELMTTSIPNMDVAVSTRASQSSLNSFVNSSNTIYSFITNWLEHGVIKSIQRGVLYNNAASGTITISEVDVDKTIVITSASGYSSGSSARNTAAAVSLTDSTTLSYQMQMTGSSALAYGYTAWQVVEFY